MRQRLIPLFGIVARSLLRLIARLCRVRVEVSSCPSVHHDAQSVVQQSIRSTHILARRDDLNFLVLLVRVGTNAQPGSDNPHVPVKLVISQAKLRLGNRYNPRR